MSFPYFIARRIYSNGGRNGQASKPAVTIAMTGIAIGMVVMILSIAVTMGFKQQVREKVIGFGAHIQVANFNRSDLYEMNPIVGADSVMKTIMKASTSISHIQRYTTKAGILKTDDNFHGFILKGIGQEYDTAFIAAHIVEGSIPQFSDTAASGQILISRQMARRMNLQLGDRINTYFIQKNVRARRFTIRGIYETNFGEYDNRFLITDIYTATRLNNWKDSTLVSGIEVSIHSEADLELAAEELGKAINHQTDRYGNAYLAQSIEQLYPSIFAWLDVLDTNVLVILILMTGVAGFTMISGLLILILERTNMIGILKALGATNLTVRSIFLHFSTFLIGKGMLWGNIVGISFCLLQKQFGIVRLDPTTYYVDTVPVLIDIPTLVLLNAITLIISVAMLIGPSMLISHIKPAKAIRFE